MARTRILTLSNDSVLQRFLTRNAMGADYDISIREEMGQDLKAVVAEEFPDLILLDIMMPNLAGIEVCLRIRQWSRVPIIMLSTWGAGEGRVRGLNLGAAGYLTESFGIEELKHRIQSTLRRNLAAARATSGGDLAS